LLRVCEAVVSVPCWGDEYIARLAGLIVEYAHQLEQFALLNRICRSVLRLHYDGVLDATSLELPVNVNLMIRRYASEGDVVSNLNVGYLISVNTL
jgi:hypothetical protein